MAGQSGDRRARLAAQQAAQKQAQTRKRRLLLAGGAIVVVVAVVLGFVLSSGSGSSGSTAGSTAPPPTGSALTSVVDQLTSVPAATLDQVGAGQTASNPTSITGTALTSAGKPEVLYMGAEYCPYCAAERWALIVALSRFGTFSGLAPIRSAAADGAGTAEPYPLTATWTFLNATYTSTYLTFTSVEQYTNIPDKATGFYTTLQTPTAAETDAARQVRRDRPGRDPVHRLRQQVREHRRVLQPRDSGRADLGADHRRPAQSGQPGSQVGARRGQLRDRGALRSHRQPARVRLHLDRARAAGQNLGQDLRLLSGFRGP